MKRSERTTGCLLGGSAAALSLLLIVVVFRSLTGAGPLFPIVGTPEIPPGSKTTPPNDWYSVYFSDPDGPTAGSLRGGPDAALASAIERARLSVDVAIYDLDLWSIRDALVAAHQRGVAVRVVTESDNLDREEMQELVAVDVQVLGDRREGLMHNKFVVIDHQEVWTGSMNLLIGH